VNAFLKFQWQFVFNAFWQGQVRKKERFIALKFIGKLAEKDFMNMHAGN
jgi:hypothetical protein